MAIDERHIETETPGGATHTHTTVIERGGGSGSGWLIGLVLLLALLIGGYFVLQASRNDAARTDAIGEAAGKVGNAAEKAGDAVKDAVN